MLNIVIILLLFLCTIFLYRTVQLHEQVILERPFAGTKLEGSTSANNLLSLANFCGSIFSLFGGQHDSYQVAPLW